MIARRYNYESQRAVNPTGIVPVGPELDFQTPHGREALGGAARAA